MFDNCLTKGLQLRLYNQYVILMNMKEETVNIREFIRNYNAYAKKHTAVVITSYGKPIWVCIPFKEWEKCKQPQSVSFGKPGKSSARNRKISMAEIVKKYGFKGGDPDLSSKVDEIVYGAPNLNRNDDN